MTLSNLIGIVGPTASGKSALAIALAEKIGGEIVSVDSMQVYRGLDIGTAKPSRAEQDRVPHHLIDVIDVDREFDAAMFVALAREAILDVQQRNKVPILCGGTGLYLQALLAGLGSAPPSDPQLRGTLEATPIEQLLAELQRADPALFQRMDRRNRRRVVRAIEVIRLTGRPYSSQRAPWSESLDRMSDHGILVFGIERTREDLRRRIDARVDNMFENGLVAETREMLCRGLARNRNAAKAIGYCQVAEHLCGERGLSETIALIREKTRQYAKRQITWFRQQLPVQWTTVQPDEPVDSPVQHVVHAWHNSRRDPLAGKRVQQ